MGADPPDDAGEIASHALAHLRALDKKMDLVLDAQARCTERLGRVERGVDEVRRDPAETKCDVVLVESRILSTQTDILPVLRRLEQAAMSPPPEDAESAAPTPTRSKQRARPVDADDWSAGAEPGAKMRWERRGASSVSP